MRRRVLRRVSWLVPGGVTRCCGERLPSCWSAPRSARPPARSWSRSPRRHQAMSDQEGFGWLPPSVARRMAAEEQRERREAREAERARQARAEAAQERAVALYAAQAQARGEDL